MATYLWLNCALYTVFGVTCLLQVQSSAKRLGYAVLTPSGISEYSVVYGGLQLGLAAFFGFLAITPAYTTVAIVFSLCLYVPIVLCRLASVVLNWPVAKLTLAVGILEILLLMAGIAIAVAKMR